jgi:lysophospholipase L1-like esterase
MRIILIILLLLFPFGASTQEIDIKNPVRFIALGDSYTIGQGIDYNSNWPNQIKHSLFNYHLEIEQFKIIAKTGWRTDQLIDAIEEENPDNNYNLVSLLIGVNNQYQGRDLETYKIEFEELLNMAIELANNNPSQVFVLSIPDYAYTPFGGQDPEISAEIDQFNNENQKITENYNVKYIDITDISRMGIEDPTLIADDGLHPSEKMYTLWVNRILDNFQIPEITGSSTIIQENPNITYSNYNRNIEIQTQIPGQIMKLYHISGALRLTRNLLSYNKIMLKNFNSGIYTLAIENNNQIIYTKKLYIQ